VGNALAPGIRLTAQILSREQPWQRISVAGIASDTGAISSSLPSFALLGSSGSATNGEHPNQIKFPETISSSANTGRFIRLIRAYRYLYNLFTRAA